MRFLTAVFAALVLAAPASALIRGESNNQVLVTPAYIGTNADPNTASAVAVSSQATFVAVTVPVTVTMTGIRFEVGTQSGNVDVGVYDNAGNRKASSGATACPAAGLATVNFSAPITLNPGIYYLALAASNTTSTFFRFGTGGIMGVNSFSTSYPLPASVTLPGTVSSRAFALLGIVSGGISQ